MAQRIGLTWADMLDAGISRRARQPCQYEAYLPDLLAGLPVNLSGHVAADVSEAERSVQHLNSSAPALARLEAVARLLLRAESVASSRIEGLEVGLGRLARAEAAKQLGESINDVTAEAVIGNIAAMELAVNQLAAKERLDVEDLHSIHRALMQHTKSPELGGQVRTVQNWIGGNDYNPCGADFVPPPPEFVTDLLEDLVAFLNSEDSPPLVQAALAHAQFETIHPFADGNGRVGRALIHLVLRRRDLAPRYVPPISLVLATDSRDYVAGLRAFRYVGAPTSPAATQGIANWIATFASATTRAVDDARQLASDVDALEQRWRRQAAPIRKNSAADLLLRVLPAAPIVTVSTAAQLTGRTFQAADLAIARLTKAGVLRQTKLGRRNRAFEAVGLLDALTVIERRLASPARDTRVSEPARRVPMLSSALGTDPSFVQRFYAEARHTASLEHPNIVPIYDLGEAGGSVFIAMRYIDGLSLEELLARETQLHILRAISIGAQVAEALDHGHGRGIIHRDVKPANIMIEPGDRATLTDFGIAMVAGSSQLTRTGSIVGTPNYLSPEQACGSDIDARTDLYALAIVTYEMLAGRPPFQSENPLSVVRAHIATTPPPVTAFNPSVPAEVAAVLLRAMAKEPAQRFANCREFMSAVRQAATAAV